RLQPYVSRIAMGRQSGGGQSRLDAAHQLPGGLGAQLHRHAAPGPQFLIREVDIERVLVWGVVRMVKIDGGRTQSEPPIGPLAAPGNGRLLRGVRTHGSLLRYSGTGRTRS